MIFTDAKALCESVGMRLCKNRREVKKAILRISDPCEAVKGKKRVWVDRPCYKESGPTRAYTVQANDGSMDECTAVTSTSGVACCADSNPGTYCTDCPVGSTSAAGSVELKDCVCSKGYNRETSSATLPYCQA